MLKYLLFFLCITSFFSCSNASEKYEDAIILDTSIVLDYDEGLNYRIWNNDFYVYIQTGNNSKKIYQYKNASLVNLNAGNSYEDTSNFPKPYYTSDKITNNKYVVYPDVFYIADFSESEFTGLALINDNKGKQLAKDYFVIGGAEYGFFMDAKAETFYFNGMKENQEEIPEEERRRGVYSVDVNTNKVTVLYEEAGSFFQSVIRIPNTEYLLFFEIKRNSNQFYDPVHLKIHRLTIPEWKKEIELQNKN